MGQLIASHLVLVWAVGALFVGAFDPLGEMTSGEQAFNGIFMLFVVAGVGAWAARTRAARRHPAGIKPTTTIPPVGIKHNDD